MDDIPPRFGQTEPRDVHYKAWRLYFSRFVVSQLGFIVLIGSFTVGAFGGAIYLNLSLMAGGVIGGLTGALVFNFAVSLYVQKQTQNFEEAQKHKRDLREAEKQRQLAEAKKNGAFDRFGQTKKETDENVEMVDNSG